MLFYRPDPQPVTWNVVSDIQRENIVQEISELVHQHLVTQTLEGGFRNVLEFHLRVGTVSVIPQLN